MKLRRFQIDGFKALAGLDIAMSGDELFLIGMNGAGKSSVLQALSFVRHYAAGRAVEYFEERQWQISDLRPRIGVRTVKSAERVMRLSSPKNLHMILSFDDAGVQIFWEFVWSYGATAPLFEAVWLKGSEDPIARSILNVSRPTRGGSQADDAPVPIKVEDLRLGGSVLSAVPADRLAHGGDAQVLDRLHQWSQGITSLELLSPIAMRRGIRGKPKDIGPRGERLAAFIASLTGSQRDDLVSRVSRFYPLADLEAIKKNAGWIDMRMQERYADMLRISPTHMSDGFLRILALCAIPDFDQSVSLVLLDEVEDGIEPHILPDLIDFVGQASSCQLIMTSHSPLLINHFEPEQVCFLARLNDGRTALARPSEMELFIKGAEYFGVGEIWANADVDSLVNVIKSRDANKDLLTIQRRSTAEQVTRFMEGL